MSSDEAVKRKVIDAEAVCKHSGMLLVQTQSDGSDVMQCMDCGTAWIYQGTKRIAKIDGFLPGADAFPDRVNYLVEVKVPKEGV